MLRFIPILFVIILIVSLDKVSSNGHTDLTLNHRYFPLGVIGCMVGEGLCGAKESCIDDNLFGICSEKGLPLQVPNYDLTDPQRIGLLESKILKLLIEGYTWQDAYTQCIVQNLLVASAATTLDAALPLDCSGGGHGASGSVGGADETISPLLLSRWSLLNDGKDLDDAEHRDVMAGRNYIISDSGLSAAAIIGDDFGGGGGGGGGESISDGDDGDGDSDDDDHEEEERQEQDVGGDGDDDDGGNSIDGSLDYNSDVYDSVPIPPVQQPQQHPNFLKSSKRDEIVRIHKYFDQPAVPSRRSSEPPLSREEALAERYGLMPNGELIDSIPAADRNKVFEQVFNDAGSLDGDSIVADNGNEAVDDDDSVVDREALRLINEISASADPKLEDQGNENLINADIDDDANAPLDLTPLTYVPPDSSRLDSNIIVAGEDQNNNNNYNTENGDDDDGNTDRDDRSLKRSVAENLVDFDGTERNQLLPQYLLNLQKLLSEQIGSESESQRENERERGVRMKFNNPDENLVGNRELQDEMTNKMIMDYPRPDYSLLSDLANDYRGMNDKGRFQQDNGLGANSLKPGTKGLWGEDFKQMPEMDYDYDYPTETAASDPRFPVFKSSLKSDESLPNMDRPIDSDKLDLSNADSEALKTLLKDILMKAVDVPPSQSQSVGASLSDSGSNDGKFMSNDLGDIDLSQLKQAEELLRKTGQLKSKSLLNLNEGDRHPKFTLLQRVGEPVYKKAVLMENENDETATVSEEKPGQATDQQKHYDQVDANYAFVGISNGNVEKGQALKLVRKLEEIMKLPSGTFSGIRLKNGQVTFRISPDVDGITASTVAKEVENHREELEAITGLQLSTAGIGDEVKVVQTTGKSPKYYTLTFVLCGIIATAILAVVAFYMFRQHHQSRQKLAQLSNPDTAEASKDYQDLCRQKMQSKSSEKPEPLHAATRIASVSEAQVRSPSSRSSTSSWSEEPVSSNMDISTGHIVLSYMEDHLQNRDRLDQEWEALCAYEADPCCTDVAMDTSNARKNRYSDVLPYNHSRVLLNQSTNASGSDYINASTITDHDPKNPAYIATQGPLPHTVADFWQMVWEQGSVVIVMLTKLTENADAMCHRYWPEEGSDLYHIYEVHLVSEHIWCDDYLVRSFYLKNLQTNETRTVTQFHFLSWLDLSIPTSVKVLLDFRRKVNKSFRGRSCPIVVHCNDGCGRTGTYILMDMVLNRMAKGAKEIDIAATLEHIRDQRMKMVRVKEQFQYSLALVAEEVHAILKALPQ